MSHETGARARAQAQVAAASDDPHARLGAFLSLGRVLPNRYPLDQRVESSLADEQRLGRLLDYAVILPRLQRLYEWSAGELGEPGPPSLVQEGSPTYSWPPEERHVWRSPAMPFAGRILERATRPA